MRYDDVVESVNEVEGEIFASVHWAVIHNRNHGADNVAADAVDRFAARLAARTKLKDPNPAQRNAAVARVQQSLTANAAVGDEVAVAAVVAADLVAHLRAAGLVT